MNTPMTDNHDDIQDDIKDEQGASPPSPEDEGTADAIEPIAEDSTPVQKRRRRVTRACDECRRKKINNYFGEITRPNAECTYDQPSHRRRNPQPQYIEALEHRLQRAEALLKCVMPNVDLNDPNIDIALQNGIFPNAQSTFAQPAAHDTRLPAPNQQESKMQPSDSSKDPRLESMVRATGQLELDEDGYWDFHGHSSGLSFARGLRESLGDLMGPDTRGTPFVKPRQLRPLSAAFESPTSNHESPFESATSAADLPSKRCALQLCGHALNDASALLKVIHQPSFYRLLDRVYEVGPDNGGNAVQKFLPLLYSVLALGCLFSSAQESTLEKYGYENAIDQGVQYFKAARQLLDIVDCRDITSLQALIYMILFLQCSAKLSTCYAYIGIALRSALRLGLHRSFNSGFNPIEAETRKRTFWVIRKMDIYVGAIIGLPQTLSDDDIDQDLPAEVEDENITETEIIPVPPSTTTIMQAANAHNRLIKIMHDIVRIVYPIKNPQQTGHLNQYSVSIFKIRELEKALQEWKEKLPLGLRPGEAAPRIVRAQQLLRIAYAYTQVMLYRPFLHYVSKEKQGKAYDPKAYACGMACVSVSRNIVHITAEMKRQGLLIGSHWFIMYTTFFAILSLIFYAIENPDTPTSQEVLKDAHEGRATLASLAKRSMAADRCTATLNNLFEHLPQGLERGRQNIATSKKRRSAASPNLPTSAPGSSSKETANHSMASVEPKRAVTFPNQGNGTQNGRKAFPPSLALSQNSTPINSPSFMGSPDFLNSSASDSGPNSLPMSANQPNFPVAGNYQPSALSDLSAIMFPSNDPFAYPSQAVTSFDSNHQFNNFMPNGTQASNGNTSPRDSMYPPLSATNAENNGNLDVELFGPLPPFMSQNQQQQQFGTTQPQHSMQNLKQNPTQQDIQLNNQMNGMMNSGSENYMNGTMPTTADWNTSQQTMRTGGLPAMNLDDIFGGEEWSGMLMDPNFRQ
ncbi:MAG: hypothetical protein M1820_006120 [Bogoriella megaspora]|nr:MAG: hypothetical protein M1820_006120 [Bogoriella megaspora]